MRCRQVHERFLPDLCGASPKKASPTIAKARQLWGTCLFLVPLAMVSPTELRSPLLLPEALLALHCLLALPALPSPPAPPRLEDIRRSRTCTKSL